MASMPAVVTAVVSAAVMVGADMEAASVAAEDDPIGMVIPVATPEQGDGEHNQTKTSDSKS